MLLSWSEDMDMLYIKFLGFVSFFCSANLSCVMLVYILKDKQKVAEDINSLSLLVYLHTGTCTLSVPVVSSGYDHNR